MHLSPDLYSAAVVDTGGAITDFRGLEKGRSLISAYQSLAITPSTSGFEKLSTVLILYILKNFLCVWTLQSAYPHYVSVASSILEFLFKFEYVPVKGQPSQV